MPYLDNALERIPCIAGRTAEDAALGSGRVSYRKCVIYFPFVVNFTIFSVIIQMQGEI